MAPPDCRAKGLFCWISSKRVRFFAAEELVSALELEKKSQGEVGQLAHRLVHMDLVIFDELGYLPFSQAGGALLFHLICERTSVLITII
ncbi:IstB-like ATP binding protein [compost metagenome]